MAPRYAEGIGAYNADEFSPGACRADPENNQEAARVSNIFGGHYICCAKYPSGICSSWHVFSNRIHRDMNEIVSQRRCEYLL
jgi:hypothetical protein